ncbi:hypothetical protein PIB30_029705 [Stylosanthes scabra]|uniref:Uncharacterized protein n=1 Tax=Stylosanthes scabra TaxID=79078 RepID=A0ABU6W9Q7_9FABA|nr:hypothetical protein [Stylosanthes scabra]
MGRRQKTRRCRAWRNQREKPKLEQKIAPNGGTLSNHEFMLLSSCTALLPSSPNPPHDVETGMTSWCKDARTYALTCKHAFLTTLHGPNTHPLNQNNTTKHNNNNDTHNNNNPQSSLFLPTLSLSHHQHSLSIRHNLITGAPIAAPSPATRSSRPHLRIHTRIKVSVTKESIRGVSNRLAGPKLLKIFEFVAIESIRSSSEPIRRVDSRNTRIDSDLLKILKMRNLMGGIRANDSAYGDSRLSGVVSACGVLVSTWDKS